MIMFSRFCEKVAALENREDELHSIQEDDNGLNAFKREQYRKILQGDYKGFADDVVLMGDKLRRCFAILRIATVFIFVITIAINYFACA